MHATGFSCVWFFVTPWAVARHAPLSMGFSRQEHWSGFATSFSRGSSHPRNETQISYIAGGFFTYWAMREAQILHKYCQIKCKCNVKH